MTELMQAAALRSSADQTVGPSFRATDDKRDFQGSEGDWSLIIRPKSGWFDLHLRDLWRYQGPGCPVYPSRFCRHVQANHPGPALVYYPTRAYHAHFHSCFWEHGQASDRWPPQDPFLPFRRHRLELFRRVSYAYFEYLCRKREPVRKGLLPAFGSATQHRYFEPHQVRDSVRSIPAVYAFLSCSRDPKCAPRPRYFCCRSFF